MNQRIRINSQGQITETRNVNAIKINGQNRPTADYPADVIMDADGGGWLIPVYADPGDGRITASHWAPDGLYAQQMIDAYKTADEVAAQAQIDRHNQVLAMTDAYGADVAILGRLLGAFGVSLPCDPTEAIQTIKGGLATGAIDFALAPQADAAEGRYKALREHMTDEDIAAVASLGGGL